MILTINDEGGGVFGTQGKKLFPGEVRAFPIHEMFREGIPGQDYCQLYAG